MSDLERAPLDAHRADFLLTMYKAMWDNINRHILVVWQSVTALLAAFGAAYLSGKGVIDPDLAVSFVLLAAAWAIAHAIDSKGWFNRNLLIISNIEKLFLRAEDRRLVHEYFGRPHRAGFIEHLSIQVALDCAVAITVLAQHFFTRVVPGFDLPWGDISGYRALPYVIALLGACLLWLFNRKVNTGFKELRTNSPGFEENQTTT